MKARNARVVKAVEFIWDRGRERERDEGREEERIE